MRFLSGCSLLILLVMIVGLQTADAQFEGVNNSFNIGGKLIYLYQQAPCERCEVLLESNGIPVGSVFSDAVGNFVFTGLRAGSYTLKVELQGFEKVEQRVEVSNLFDATTIVMLTPKTAVGGDSDNHDVVHVSTYLDQYPEKAVKLYKKADKSAGKGKRTDAIKNLEEAVKIAPDFYHAHNYLGLLYKDEGRFADAANEFEIARNLNESSADPLINLSGLYIDDGQTDLAIKTGEEAVKKDSRSALAFFNLGLAFFRAAKLLPAQEALQKALQLAPKMAQARLALANVFIRLQNFMGLREQLTRFLDENPKATERGSVEELLRQIPQEQPGQ
jgi:Tfp pilus assembly protein PilF